MTQGPQTAPPESGLRWFRIVAVILVVLAAGVGAWLLLRDSGDDPSRSDAGEPERPRPKSTAVSARQLRALRRGTGYDLYWAGPRPGATYELTRTADGATFIRYLPQGVSVGDPSTDYLTIGTYPRQNAFRGLRRLARRDSVSLDVVGRGIAVYRRDRPQSVYLAFPGEEVQVEVYDPSPERARRLARSGRVRAIR